MIGDRKYPELFNGNKYCTTCGQELPNTLEYFSIRNVAKDGLAYSCRECARKRYQDSKPKTEEERQILLLKNKKYREKNKDRINERMRRAYRTNPNIKKSKKKWRDNNKEIDYQCRLLSCKKRQERDNSFRISNILRARVVMALRRQGVRKSTRTKELIGCSIATLKTHLESQFKDGMSWENHAKKGWHIDHIKPCASFDFTDIKQQKECFHYTNLQPLWCNENWKKGCCL